MTTTTRLTAAQVDALAERVSGALKDDLRVRLASSYGYHALMLCDATGDVRPLVENGKLAAVQAHLEGMADALTIIGRDV